MSGDVPELSSRYYAAERSVWLIAAVLLLARYFGLADSQTVPVIGIKLRYQAELPRLIAALLCFVVAILILEWKLSARRSRERASSQVRFSLTLAWATGVIWASYGFVASGTRFAAIAPGWFVVFIVLGVLVGALASLLIDAMLMIRTREEADRIHLPRTPAASHALLIAFVPGCVILLGLYYYLRFQAPVPIRDLTWAITGIVFLLVVLQSALSWLLPQDANGQRITFSDRRAALQRIFDGHDYQYFLGANAEEISSTTPIRPASPQEAQRIVRQQITRAYIPDRINFHVRLLETLSFVPFAKDNDPTNDSPQNRGVRVLSASNRPLAAVPIEIIWEGVGGTQPMQLPVELVERCAEEHLATLARVEDAVFRKLVSYALDESVRKILARDARGALYHAAMACDRDVVREIIGLGGNVNDRSEFGWTPVLAAAAQGNDEILEDLLNAGADPDTPNLQGVTPLHHAARYGNVKVCRVLLDHGADVESRDFWGATPLMVAAAQGQESIVEALLAADADPLTLNHKSKTALDIAEQSGYGSIAKMLRNAARKRQA